MSGDLFHLANSGIDNAIDSSHISARSHTTAGPKEKLNMFSNVGVDHLGSRPGISPAGSKGTPGAGVSFAYNGGSGGGAAEVSGMSADGNIATGGSMAVLSALRALQEKIRRLETERAIALEEATRIRQEAKEQQIDMQRDSDKEKLTLQKTINESRVAYEALEEQKNSGNLRLVRAEEQINEYKKEISYLHEKIGGCEERLSEAREQVSKLEMSLEAKEGESKKAAEHSKEITQTIVWETKRHEDEKAELMARARQLHAELSRTRYDLDVMDKRKIELETTNKQLVGTVKRFEDAEKKREGNHHHHYQHHHHAQHGDAHGHHGHGVKSTHSTGGGSVRSHSKTKKHSSTKEVKEDKGTHARRASTASVGTHKTASKETAASRRASTATVSTAHATKKTTAHHAKEGEHHKTTTGATAKKGTKKVTKKKAKAHDDDSTIASYVSSGSYYSQISGKSGQGSIMSQRSKGSKGSGRSLTRKNVSAHTAKIELESSMDKKGGGDHNNNDHKGGAKSKNMRSRSSTLESMDDETAAAIIAGSSRVHGGTDGDKTNITVTLPSAPRVSSSSGGGARGRSSTPTNIADGIAFAAVGSPDASMQMMPPATGMPDQSDAAIQAAQYAQYQAFQLQQQQLDATAQMEAQQMHQMQMQQQQQATENNNNSYISVEDSLAKYDDALQHTGSTLRDFTTNLDTSMSLSSALAAGPGLVPANYVLPGNAGAVGSGYGSSNNRSAINSSLHVGMGHNGNGNDLDSVIKSLEDEFLLLNNSYRRLLTTVQNNDSNGDSGAESKDADELVAVINKLHKKGEQLRKLRTGKIPDMMRDGSGGVNESMNSKGTAAQGPMGMVESHLDSDRSMVQAQMEHSTIVLSNNSNPVRGGP
jgi:hypothetical protein